MPPSPAGATEAATAASLPAGLYRQYKRSTAFFLSWLLRARHSVASSATAHTDRKQPLDLYDRLVHGIAHDPTTLPPAQLRLWPRALAACETAITLRARAALFFPTAAATSASAASHAHFLNRLRQWLQTLQATTRPTMDETSTTTATAVDTTIDFSNYYDVLALPDDYFPDADESVSAAPAIGTSVQSLTEAERKRLVDEAFTEDLNAELACLFMELEELAEAVYAAFFAVKEQKKTLVEATAVAKIAIDSAASVIATLQLQYPSIRNANDMWTLIQDRVPKRELDQQVTKIVTAWYPRETKAGATYRYEPGTLLVDMLWVSRALIVFATAIPEDPRQAMVTREGFFGHAYNEEETPQYVVPDMTSHPAFLAQQLPLLMNMLRLVQGVKRSTTSLKTWFFGHFEPFFASRTASIHTVFVSICWVRSVAALQGDAGLGRNIGLTVMHGWDLETRLTRSIQKGAIRRTNPALHKELEYMLETIKLNDRVLSLVRTNPLLAGCVLLDDQFRFLYLGADATLAATRLRGFGHLYAALRDRQLLDPIPFFDNVLQVYERAVFTPSRAAVSHGSFLRSYLLSSDMTEAAIDAMMHRRPPPRDRYATRVRERFHLKDISRIFRLLHEKDYSVLPSATPTASWKTLLESVSDVCTQELFETRVLSRDMLKVCDDLTEVLETLCDTLGCRADVDRIAADGGSHRALEDAVVMPILTLLDCLNRDGTTRASEDVTDLLRLENVRRLGVTLDNKLISSNCRKVANVIARRFARRTPKKIEADYFSFPATHNWSSLEFGSASFHKAEPQRTTTDKCRGLLRLMETNSGPLDEDAVAHLKKVIISDPLVLGVAGTGELATLFHYAAAGPARDRRLVEWMHQMGALYFQPRHCRERPAPSALRSIGMTESQLFNALAVHCAAKAGLVDMVRFLLDADNRRDLNTVTYHTKESLVHLAVKHGHRELYDMLVNMGADVTKKDAAGNHVYDLTTDKAWKRTIVQEAVQRRQQDEMLRDYKNRDHELQRESEVAANKLRRELDTQRTSERSRLQEKLRRRRLEQSKSIAATSPLVVTASSSPATPLKDTKATGTSPSPSTEAPRMDAGSTKKKKTKKKKNLPDQQFISSATYDIAATDSRMEKLAQLLDDLKESRDRSVDEQSANAQAALEIVDTFRFRLHHYVTANVLLDTSPAMDRDALDASRVIFLLNKYHRQLPEPPIQPHHLLGQRLQSEDAMSPVQQVQKRAGPETDFVDFLSFVAHTARVLVACGRVPQAKELLELVERRMLKFKQRSPAFRDYVELYVDTRRQAGIEPSLGSSPDARKQLEWYASDHGIHDPTTLIKMDMLRGRQWFLRAKCVESFSSRAFAYFEKLVEISKPPEMDCVCVDGYIVAGADTHRKLLENLKFIFVAVRESGLHLHENMRDLETRDVTLRGFTFSATAIVKA